MPKYSARQTEFLRLLWNAPNNAVSIDSPALRVQGGPHKTMDKLRSEGVVRFMKTTKSWALTATGVQVCAVLFEEDQKPVKTSKKPIKVQKIGAATRKVAKEDEEEELDEDGFEPPEDEDDENLPITADDLRGWTNKQLENEMRLIQESKRKGRPSKEAVEWRDMVRAEFYRREKMPKMASGKCNGPRKITPETGPLARRTTKPHVETVFSAFQRFQAASIKASNAPGYGDKLRIMRLAQDEFRAEMEKLGLAQHMDWTDLTA